jgi:MFS transporter, PHS family, inorganic phosphate transporter
MENDLVVSGSEKIMTPPSKLNRTPIDVNERRRRALAEVDNAPLSFKHIRIILVAGSGFFTDAYDLFSANFITGLIGYAYFAGNLPASLDTAIKVSTAAGTVIGQLLFGWLADRIGRKRMYGIELIFMIIGSIGQSIAGTGPAVEIVGAIIFWRVVMGVGVGGDYPLSSVITAEFATVRWRGAMMNAVFAMYTPAHFLF